jgi:uncharacterized RDD family membrane protein YckC
MEEREPSMLRPDGAVVLPDRPLTAGTAGTAGPAGPAGPAGTAGALEAAGARARARALPRDTEPVVWAAGLWRRALAALLDGLVVAPFSLGAVWVAGRLAHLDLPTLRGSSLDTWLDLALAGDPGFLGALGLGLAVLVVYLYLFQALTSRTLGMRALGLDIIDLTGAPLGPLRAGVRTLGYLAGLATLGLGFLWVGFDRERRGLHDWLAGTLVTRPPPHGAHAGG